LNSQLDISVYCNNSLCGQNEPLAVTSEGNEQKSQNFDTRFFLMKNR
jgi:hypothetical protein